jgi:ATP-dependent Clp protease adaptor protein ClpS
VLVVAEMAGRRGRGRRGGSSVVVAEVEGATVEPVLAGGASPAVPVRERQPDTRERTRTDQPWDVIVWDDPVNLMSYVVFVFRRVFGYPEPVARQLMLEVHRKGKALVASEPREQAELYVQQLHGYGLHATMQRAS